MSLESDVRSALAESARMKRDLARGGTASVIRAAKVTVAAYRAGRRAFFFGNGGSAADAQHAAAELVGRYARNRPGLAAHALHAETSTLTALANDFGYEAVFSHQIRAFGRKGDVAIGITTSGSSKNVVKALAEAKSVGMKTIALTGESGGPAADLADVAVRVPSRTTARIQEGHILVLHAICQAVEEALFPGAPHAHHQPTARQSR